MVKSVALRAAAACLLAMFAQPSAVVAQTGAATLPNGYSAVPLREPSALSAQQLEEETRKLLAWLEANGPGLTRAQMAGPREQAYYLIGERIKHLYAAEQRILPDRRDRVLQMLFMNADNLGVHGGSQIFEVLKDPAMPSMPVRAGMPRGLSVALEGDLLRVRSDLGWTFAVPYHFMIWQAADQQRPGGRIQAVTLSTGTASDRSALGHSQATLMMFFSPQGIAAIPMDVLRTQLGPLDGTPRNALGIRGLLSQHVVNETTKLHSEVTSWIDESGAYLVVYSGNDGSYQTNRPHFLDFLNSIRKL